MICGLVKNAEEKTTGAQTMLSLPSIAGTMRDTAARVTIRGVSLMLSIPAIPETMRQAVPSGTTLGTRLMPSIRSTAGEEGTEESPSPASGMGMSLLKTLPLSIRTDNLRSATKAINRRDDVYTAWLLR